MEELRIMAQIGAMKELINKLPIEVDEFVSIIDKGTSGKISKKNRVVSNKYMTVVTLMDLLTAILEVNDENMSLLLDYKTSKAKLNECRHNVISLLRDAADICEKELD